jgi:DNA-binding transcriptional ArsR family regulator
MAKRIPEDMLARMAARFRILGDTSRLAMLYCLIEGGEMNVGQIGETIGRNQSSVSKHLKLMVSAGILVRRKEGLQVFYRLQDTVWEQICRLLSNSLHNGMRE